MSRVTIKVTGIAKARANIKQALANIEAGTEVALDVVSEDTLDDMKNGTPIDTGRLRNSENVYKARLDRQIGTDVEYAWYVHDGTFKMAARPYATNAFEANQSHLVPELRRMKIL